MVITLDKLLLWLLVLVFLLVPIQLGYHFWPDYATIHGIRQDLLSSIIYLSDLAIFGLIFTYALRLIVRPQNFQFRQVLLISIVPLSFLLSSFFSENFQLSIYKTAKVTEFALLAFCLTQLRLPRGWLVTVIGFSNFWVAIVAVLQFFNQKSLGLWILGERLFSTSTPGIALVTISGEQLLRPYSTFPHPNVLAGFLVLSLPILILSIPDAAKIHLKLALIGTVILALFALMLSFSRSGWLAFSLISVIILLYFIRERKLLVLVKDIINQHFQASLLLFLVIVLVFVFGLRLATERFTALTTSDSHSLLLRQKLAASSLTMFRQSPIVGLGPGQFLPDLPDYFLIQETIRIFSPVHNIYLLQLAETGIIGLIALLVLQLSLLIFTRKMVTVDKLIVICHLIAIVVIGNLDHYFFTLQQGQLLFWLATGFGMRGD